MGAEGVKTGAHYVATTGAQYVYEKTQAEGFNETVKNGAKAVHSKVTDPEFHNQVLTGYETVKGTIAETYATGKGMLDNYRNVQPAEEQTQLTE